MTKSLGNGISRFEWRPGEARSAAVQDQAEDFRLLPKRGRRGAAQANPMTMPETARMQGWNVLETLEAGPAAASTMLKTS
ncbi:MAG: hypothetical protein OXC26_05460 [Albidovulum sp.]|nr:hypothetical protein [Albidovulum sp.]